MECHDNSVEIVPQQEIPNAETEKTATAKLKPPEIWDGEDRKTFYHLLCKHGKDFPRIAARLNKLRPLKTKTSRQVTNFFLQNYKRLRSAVSFSPDIPQEVQELSLLLAYGELHKRLGAPEFIPNLPKYLSGLIFHRKVFVGVKTLRKLGIASEQKFLKITFPPSKVLKELFKKHEFIIPRHLPETLVFSLKPRNVQALLACQKSGLNANIQLKVAHGQNIKTLMRLLAQRFTESRGIFTFFLPAETSPMTYQIISSAKKSKLHKTAGELSAKTVTAFVPVNSVVSLPHTSPPLNVLTELWENGMTAEKADKISAVDVYLMLGSKNPVELAYDWILDQSEQNSENSAENWRNLLDFPRSALSCLVDMARSELLQHEVRKATGKTGHVKFNKPCILCRQTCQHGATDPQSRIDEIDAAENNFNFIVPEKRNLPHYPRKIRQNDDFPEKRKIKTAETRKSVLTPSAMMSQFQLTDKSVVNPVRIIHGASQTPLQGLIDATLKKPVIPPPKRYFDLMFDSPSLPVDSVNKDVVDVPVASGGRGGEMNFVDFGRVMSDLMEDEDTFDMMR